MTEMEIRHFERHRWGRGLAGIAWTWVWLIVIYGGGFLCFLHYISSVVPPDPNIKTDAIVVLTGGANRINDGLDMLSAGEAPQLFISGVGVGVTRNSILALWNGGKKLAPCCITLGRQAQNTRQNAEETAAWARQQHVHAMRLVTSGYHMPRAWLEFHAAIPEVEILLCPSKPAADGYEKINAFTLGFLEYNKTILTWFRIYLWPVGQSA